MARAESRFVCQSCGASYLRWEGQCRTCEAWNTLVESVVRMPTRAEGARTRLREPGVAQAAVPLSQIDDVSHARASVGIAELDRVLGGGLVPGSVVLLAGEPGVGKSTLLLQVAAGFVGSTGSSGPSSGRASEDRGGHALYATGEESAAQVRLRASRLGLTAGRAGEAIHVVAENEVGRIVELARSMGPALLVVDSIQTMTVDELDGPAGSVGQVREAALRLIELAKGEGIAVILVGHVTKEGSIAGPKALEHLVDAVLELGGERSGVLRLLRATKNRFGSTDEIGVFELGEAGMAEVDDPARAFLIEHEAAAPGSVVAATMEGTRPLLVEVQALVAPSTFGTPARRVSGIDPNRLALLAAVLGRRAGIGLGSHDVYANLAGGLSLSEPGLDLPLALALASSLRDRPIAPGTVAVGEVGLLGELRTVGGIERRLREAARLGFRRAVIPSTSRGRPPSVPGLEITAVASLREAIAAALGARDAAPAFEPESSQSVEQTAPGVSPVLG
ncbi:MAG: DNA repair protein RadA [Chloroflexota bacterium]